MIDVRIPAETKPAPVATLAAKGAEIAIPQLSRRGVFAIWAAAALPMGALAWIAAPLLAGIIGGPSALPPTLVVMITLGLVWQFALILILIYREQRTLRWSVVREILWLRAPRSPKTGRRGGRTWLAVLLLLAAFLASFVVAQKLTLPHPASHDASAFLGSPAGHALFHGSWG